MLEELIEKRKFLLLPSMQVYGEVMRDLKWDKHPYCPEDINSNVLSIVGFVSMVPLIDAIIYSAIIILH